MNRLNKLEREADRMKKLKTELGMKKPQREQELIIVDTDETDGRLKTDLG